MSSSRSSTGRSYLAFEAGNRVLGASVEGVSRLIRCPVINARASTDGSGFLGTATVDGAPVPIFDVHRRLGYAASPEPSNPRRHVILHERNGARIGFRIERALLVFSAAEREIQPVPDRRAECGAIAGLCSWGKLSPFIVVGALPANALALSFIARLGPLRLDRDHRLWAGPHLLNSSTTIVDEVKRKTGYGCTIFAGSRRVATTATKLDGIARALGTHANEQVVRHTLVAGRDFRGVTRTLGKDWAIVYRPLRDQKRNVVGMVATFQELTSRLFPIVDLNQLHPARTERSPKQSNRPSRRVEAALTTGT